MTKRFWVAGLAAALSASAPAAAEVTVVDAARIFDGERMIDDARLVIEDGRIVAAGPKSETAAPEGANVVDLGARFIIPGLIAAHSHVGMVNGVEHGGRFYTRETVAADLAQFQRYGVVAVNALGLNAPLFYELRVAWRDGAHGGADLYGAGPGVGMIDGAPPESMNPLPEQVARPATPDEARAAVDEMADSGVDMIKVWVDALDDSVPKMTPKVYGAAIDQAHARGLKAAAHIHDLEDAKAVVAAGVDIVAHGVRDVPVDDAFIAAMRDNRVWYVPTVNIDEAEYLYAEHPEWLDDPFFRMALDPDLEAQLRDEAWRAETLAEAGEARNAVATNLSNLRALHAAGVKIALGTDSGATALRLPGFAEHLELAHMVSAGMSAEEALASATSGAAEMMGLTDRGRLAAGARADFIVLNGDPTVDILNTRLIEAVWRNGAAVD